MGIYISAKSGNLVVLSHITISQSRLLCTKTWNYKRVSNPNFPSNQKVIVFWLFQNSHLDKERVLLGRDKPVRIEAVHSDKLLHQRNCQCYIGIDRAVSHESPPREYTHRSKSEPRLDQITMNLFIVPKPWRPFCEEGVVIKELILFNICRRIQWLPLKASPQWT